MANSKKKGRPPVLYLYVTDDTKKWLKSLCSREPGKISQSSMVARIFHKLKQHPEFLEDLHGRP